MTDGARKARFGPQASFRFARAKEFHLVRSTSADTYWQELLLSSPNGGQSQPHPLLFEVEGVPTYFIADVLNLEKRVEDW